MGALPGRDGLSATGYPSGVRGGPIEIFESMSTMIVWRKEFRPDSGGAGRTRGGLGQAIELANGAALDFTFRHTHGRITHPPRGFGGGHDGAAGYLGVAGAGALLHGRNNVIPAGARLTFLSPGGGGLGDPTTRDRAQVRRDFEDGLISAEAARAVYGYDDLTQLPEAAQ
jgi:N-methylhydantoinase B